MMLSVQATILSCLLLPFSLLSVETKIHKEQTVKTSKPCPSSLERPTGCQKRCSFLEWAHKIKTLKERPIEFSTLPLKKDYQRSILSLSEFMATLQEAARVMSRRSCANKAWYGKQSLYAAHPELYELYRPFEEPAATIKNFPFKPYTQRLLVQPETEFIFFGDLHGSIHSLIRDLEKLKDEGFINNQFALRKSNMYMVFLGDYIDRGIYGVEVMYTLARLLIANPQHVILVRGNHEDYILAPEFLKKHTKEEEKDNAPSVIDELYRKFDLSVKDEVAFFRFYEILPIALYIGSEGPSHTDFIQCCHGGLELGYNPYKLLHAPKEISFERIKLFMRKKHFTEKLAPRFRKMITDAFDRSILEADIVDIKQQAPFFKVEGTDHTMYNGFMWNGFYIDPLKTVGQRGEKFAGWVYGKELTKELLSWANSKKVTLRGIMRGHQHNNKTGGPMLNLLCCSGGIVDVWEDRTVYTLVSAPDSKLEDTGEMCFTYDSFVWLKTASLFKDWEIKHYIQDTAMEHKKWKIRHLLSPYRAPKKTRKCLSIRRSKENQRHLEKADDLNTKKGALFTKQKAEDSTLKSNILQ